MSAQSEPLSGQPATGSAPNASSNVENVQMRFDQYKLAVEMTDSISKKRQEANRFFIGVLSGFGAFYALLDRLSASSARSVGGYVLPVLPVCLCVLWRATIKSYRRINMAKWAAVYKMEADLPSAPFTWERDELGPGGSFALTKLEGTIPVIIGIVFLLLAGLPLLDWAAKGIHLW